MLCLKESLTNLPFFSGILYYLFHALRHHNGGCGSAKDAASVQFDGRFDVGLSGGRNWSWPSGPAVFQHGLHHH